MSEENPTRGWWPTSLLWTDEQQKQHQEEEDSAPHKQKEQPACIVTPTPQGDEETGSTSRGDDFSVSADGYDLQPPISTDKNIYSKNGPVNHRKSMESAKSYHSRVSNMTRNRKMTSSKSSVVSVTSSTKSKDSVVSSQRSRMSDQSSQRSRNSSLSRRSRRSDMMRRQKNMSHLIKATKGESMTLFHGTNSIAEDKAVEGFADDNKSKGDSSKVSGDSSRRNIEGQFYGWGTSSQSDFSESVVESEKEAQDNIELYVSFPDQDECDASVTDSAGSKPLNEVIMEDEYDSRRPWRKAPPIENISCESASSVQGGGSEFSVSITVEDKSRKTKHSNPKTANSKDFIRPKIGIVITTNNDNVSCSEKSNDDIKSGSDVSELIEARAALRQSQISLAGVNRSVKSSSLLPASDLSFSGKTPTFIKPEPFRPGPAFEKKFAHSNRMLSLGSLAATYPSNSSLISQKSSSTFLTKSIAEEGTCNDISPEETPNLPIGISTDDRNKNSNDGNSNIERTPPLLQPSTQSSISNPSLGSGTKSSSSDPESEMIRLANSKKEIQERQMLRKKCRRLSLLDKVDEFELEDDWDAVSAMSGSVRQQSGILTVPDGDGDDGDDGGGAGSGAGSGAGAGGDHDHDREEFPGGMNRTEERNKLLELQELYGSESDIASLQESLQSRERIRPVPGGQLRSSVSHISSSVHRASTAVRRRYFRYRSGVHLFILVSLIFVLAGTLLLVLLSGRDSDTTPSPAPSQIGPLPSSILQPTVQPLSPTIELEPVGEETSIDFLNETSQPPSPSFSMNSTEMGSNINTPSLSPSFNDGNLINNTTNTTNSNPSTSPTIKLFYNSTYLNNTQQPLATNRTDPTPPLSPNATSFNQTAPTSNSTGDESNIPTLPPSEDILAVKRKENPSNTPSPTVFFTMWPTPLDTYSRRFPPREKESSADYHYIQ